MRSSMRRLESIHKSVTADEPPALPDTLTEEQRRGLAVLSPYRQAEWQCIEAIAALRRALRTVSDLEARTEALGAPPAPASPVGDLARARQAARRAEQRLTRLVAEAQRTARREGAGREAEVRELTRHADAGRRWYRECFRVVSVGEEDAWTGPTGVDAADVKAPLLAGIDDDRNVVSAREDEEFQQFFEQVRRNDELSDAALDSISHGLSRLQKNAQVISSELQTQETLFGEMEGKVDRTSETLTGLNKRLGKMLKEKRKSDLCMYCLCCLIFVGVVLTIVVTLM